MQNKSLTSLLQHLNLCLVICLYTQLLSPVPRGPRRCQSLLRRPLWIGQAPTTFCTWRITEPSAFLEAVGPESSASDTFSPCFVPHISDVTKLLLLGSLPRAVSHTALEPEKKQLMFLDIWKKMQVRSMLLRVLASGIILSPVVSFTTRHHELQCSMCRGRPGGRGRPGHGGRGRPSHGGRGRLLTSCQKVLAVARRAVETPRPTPLLPSSMPCSKGAAAARYPQVYQKGRKVHLLITSSALMIGLSPYLQQMLRKP